MPDDITYFGGGVEEEDDELADMAYMAGSLSLP
jgi:hypothetical protein